MSQDQSKLTIDKVAQRVRAHYEASSTPLLLSQLGKTLRIENIWPTENDTRNLGQLLESMAPDVQVVRDPTAHAFAVVVPQEKVEIAEAAIRSRQSSAFLDNLPRSVVLAFVVSAPDGAPVYLQKRSPFRYNVGAITDSEYVEVESKYRLEGVRAERVRDLPPGVAESLAANIRRWLTDHDISLEIFYEKDRRAARTEVRQSVSHAIPGEPPHQRSALERLIEAQPVDIAGRIVIPADIALLLSRMR